MINELLNKTSKNTPNKLISTKANNSFVTNNSDIAEEFVDYFTNIGSNLAANITNNNDFSKYLNDRQPHCLFFTPVIESDVLSEIRRLDPNKSVGSDSIHPKLIIDSANIISSPLTHIINCSLSRGIFPDSLKIAKIIPVYKKGSTTQVGNYRPR